MATMTASMTATTPIRPVWHAIVSACMTHSSGTSPMDGMTRGTTPGTAGMHPITTTAMRAGTIGDGAGAGVGAIPTTTMEAGTTDGTTIQAAGQQPVAIRDNALQPSTDAEAAALEMVV